MFIVERMKQHPFLWLLFIYACVFFANGLFLIDGADFMRMSSDPTRMLAPIERQFLYSSPMNFFMAGLLGLNSSFGFLLIHSAEVVLMLACVAIAVQRKIEGHDRQILFITLLSLTPLWLVTFKWIGKTDPVLVALLFLSWAQASRWRVIYAVIMIWAHREIGSLMVLSLWFLEDRKDHNLLIGLVLGNVLHIFYQYGVLDYAPQTRAELMSIFAGKFLEAFSQMPAIYIMTMFSWYWIMVLLNAPMRKELLIMAAAFILSLINEDFTRDFVLAALPAMLFHMTRVVKIKENGNYMKLWPLAVLQIQVAAMGQIYLPMNNIFIILKDALFVALGFDI